jgi:hypothetical protein
MQKQLLKSGLDLMAWRNKQLRMGASEYEVSLLLNPDYYPCVLMYEWAKDDILIVLVADYVYLTDFD